LKYFHKTRAAGERRRAWLSPLLFTALAGARVEYQKETLPCSLFLSRFDKERNWTPPRVHGRQWLLLVKGAAEVSLCGVEGPPYHAPPPYISTNFVSKSVEISACAGSRLAGRHKLRVQDNNPLFAGVNAMWIFQDAKWQSFGSLGSRPSSAVSTEWQVRGEGLFTFCLLPGVEILSKFGGFVLDLSWNFSDILILYLL